MTKRIITVALFFCTWVTVFSTSLKLPQIFSDKMILQQQAEIKIWGWADPTQKLTIWTDWNGEKYDVQVKPDSTWKVKVLTPKASYNSYNLSIVSGKEKIVLKDILIGEVWFCSGQSNMDQKMKGYFRETVKNALHDVAVSTNKYIRSFNVERAGSIKMEDDVKGQWEWANPSTTIDFSATGYYYSRTLQKALDVPVGFIACSWGGSKIEAWMPASSIENFSELQIPRTEPKENLRHWTPTILFNAMVHPIAGYGIRGVLWYQGETNRKQYNQYPRYFKSMHEEWIKMWNLGDFPIYFCQLAPFDYKDSSHASAYFREAQWKISQTQPNTGMVVLMDVGEKENIHPTNKETIGNRLAYLALGKTYGHTKLPYKSPELKSVNVIGDVMTISFLNTESGLMVCSGGHKDSIGNFEIAGEDKIFYPAKAKIVPQARVEVSSPSVKNPRAVRYAFKDFVIGTLFGANGVPVSSFRTDNWDDVK